MFFEIWCCILFLKTISAQGEAFSADHPSRPSECPHQFYKIHIFSRHPLMIYIEDFVSSDEISQLLTLAEPSYEPSVVLKKDDTTGEVTQILDHSYRVSNSTVLWDGSVVDCIKRRAASLQGVSVGRIEPLQVVHYDVNGYYNDHFDWLGDTCTSYWCQRMGDRSSSMFVYLEANCTGGETEFLEMSVPEDVRGEWCEFVSCGEGVGTRTLKWKPKAGNAVFWENLDEGGHGIEEVKHAGLPVTSGSKIGLNIWTRQRENGDWKAGESEATVGTKLSDDSETIGHSEL